LDVVRLDTMGHYWNGELGKKYAFLCCAGFSAHFRLIARLLKKVCIYNYAICFFLPSRMAILPLFEYLNNNVYWWSSGAVKEGAGLVRWILYTERRGEERNPGYLQDCDWVRMNVRTGARLN